MTFAFGGPCAGLLEAFWGLVVPSGRHLEPICGPSGRKETLLGWLGAIVGNLGNISSVPGAILER